MSNPVSAAAIAATNAADAAALAAAGPPLQGSNIEAMKTAYFDRCRAWGEKLGAGTMSKVGMILDTTKAGWEGVVAPSKISEGSDAQKAYDGWRAGQKAKNPHRFNEDEKGKTRASRIAEINKYVKVGALPLIREDSDMGGYGVMKRAERIIVDNPDIKGEVEDLLSKVATRQLRSPAVPLADDQILEALGDGKAKREETYADAMGRVRAQLDSIAGKFPDKYSGNNDHKTARSCVQKIIDDEGGTAADILKREAAAKKAADKNKAKSRKKR